MPDDVLKLTATRTKAGGIEVRAETLEASDPEGTPITATYAMVIGLLDQALHVYAEGDCDCPACMSERAALASARTIVLAVLTAKTRRSARRSAKADAADPASLC